MIHRKIAAGVCAALLFGVTVDLAGCSRQQSDWQKTRETNTADAYEQFLKKYPSGEFTAQAQARVKELYEEREWQKARDADTPEAYQAFLKQYPEGKWTEEARIRVENFTLAQAPPGGAAPSTTAGMPGAALGAPAASSPQTTSDAEPVPSAAAVPPKAVAPSKAAAPPAAAKPTVKTHGAAGSYGIQLGAFKSGADAANQRWAQLKKEFPTLLSGVTSKVLPKQTAEGTLYRLRAGGLTEKHAREICGALHSKSQACVVVPPA